MAQSKRAKVANYLCRLNFRSPLGSANIFNDLSVNPSFRRLGFGEFLGSKHRRTTAINHVPFGGLVWLSVQDQVRSAANSVAALGRAKLVLRAKYVILNAS